MEALHNNFLLYKNEDNTITVDVFVKDETIWLTINQMAELFGIDKSGISRHIKNIVETGELSLESTVAKIATVQKGITIAKNRITEKQKQETDFDKAIKKLKK